MSRNFRTLRASRVPARRAANVMMEAVESRVLLSTYYVTNTNDSGSGSLRQAILNANKNAGTDSIHFKIGTGAKTISPKSALPAMSGPTILDATTQPGYAGKPLIELKGSYAGSSANGLKTTGGSTTIKGFAINRFGGFGIFLYSKGNNKVVGNYIGTDRGGTLDYGNKKQGLYIQSPSNTIGGTSSGDRNIISGNDSAGVFLYLNAASHNKILGNYIGTDVTGTKKIANKNGVQVNSGQYNTIGGTTSGARNVISGNVNDGVLIYGGGAKYNNVQGNYIGTNAAGTAKLGNGWYGVEISQSYNTVGGTTSGHRNVISGNGKDGVVVYLSSGKYNKIHGNYIGTDYTGKKDLGNTGAGVSFTNGATYNTVGGSTSAYRNIIAGNDKHGVGVYNSSHRNRVEGNWIGLNVSGYSLPNTGTPISIWVSNYTTIKNNKVVTGSSAYKPISLSSGMTTYQSGNTLYGKISTGLKVV
jgi:hypothetical protein